ncbi:TonB-dependent receptor [Ferrimonas balearica DSM 9799]|uniref:TonB-dependent receptor n=1 Tax=Ferrimonas balearica (strain DSM 9799 / CCM 4581 / KCTC 23876 / PAT) TaxID=550540 RepID=E1SW83_FERBD|nr:TonB-dependent receptor [Ferrimonas balearica]ADN75372.1 TonB-dependent receptor [Ferrimonas balearica DSM 9799]MBY6018369.1 TonB-dependent receptor [Halomonas denitrificans]MBY6094719.1 TonB-dependent receptor [Ferrimonas balearica]
MHNNSVVSKAVRFALIVGASTAALTAPAVIAAETDEVERIEVTGSRIKRTDVESSSPVQVFTAEEIQEIGFTRVEDILNQLPQVEAAGNSFISNGSSGTATLDLRGLGANRTLVLVNGRRLQPGGIYTQSADVNQIPAAMIKRVEILTGGASTTYGADAVAGVVNFIMKDDFEGFEINAGASGYQHDNDNGYIQGLMDERNFEYPTGSDGIDGEAYNIDVVMGGAFDGGKGHVTAYASWRRNNELLQGQRDYSSCALNASGTACGGSANTPIPTFFIYDENFDTELFWTLDRNGNGFVEDFGERYNYAPINHFMRPDERFTLGAFANYEINDYVRPYLEVSYMNDVTAAQIAESGTFFNEGYVMDFDNELLSDLQKQQIQDGLGIGPDDQFIAYIGKRNVEGGPRMDSLEHNSFRIVMGADGDISDSWFYDASFQYGQTSSSSVYQNDFFGPRINQAIGAVGAEPCTGDCIPYEVFTLNGVTPEAAGQLTGTGVLNGIVTQMIANAYVSGEFDFALPTASTPIAAVVGTEWREIEFERISDEVFEQGLLLGQGGPTESLQGGYDVRELFAEVSVPLIEDVVAVESLILEAGWRWSDYSTSGSDTTYKFAFDWTIFDGYKARASYNRASRAPNVAELFAAQSVGLFDGADPCANNPDTGVPDATLEQCLRTGMTAAQYGNVSASPASQYNQFAGGNPELKPETADTYTIGLVAQPFDSLNFTVDYWNIEMEDVIGTVGAQTIIDSCVENGEFCENINRNQSGSLWIGEEGYVINLSDNVGGRKWEGVDVSANYLQELLGGNFNMTLAGSYSLTKEYQPLAGKPELNYDCSGVVSVQCFAQPEWRHTLSVSYDMDSWWTATARWRYYGSVDYDGETDTLAADGIASQSYFDLVGGFTLGDNYAFRVGVNNVLDKEPPMVGGTLSSNANTVAGFYDTLGRYLFANVTLKF